MPLPKDPIKAAEYRKRMSAAQTGKKYPNRKPPPPKTPETIEKLRRAQLEICADPEEKKRRSDRAKQLGYGKWMKGRDTSHYKRQSRKGKTYEEIYGIERADEERVKRIERNRIAKLGKQQPHLLKEQARLAEQRKGKTYSEIYGERGEDEAKKRSAAHLAKWKDKPKKNDARPKHNGDHHYKEWRTAVFKRDDFTCQDCGQHGKQLHAHHIKTWAKYPQLRYEVSNGITLCVPCHKSRHAS